MPYQNLDDDPRMEQQMRSIHLKGEIESTQRKNSTLTKRVELLEKELSDIKKVLKKRNIS